jgi:hypothetical protein
MRGLTEETPMPRFARRTIAMLALCALCAPPPWSQDAATTGDSSLFSDWTFTVTPYLWLFNLTGDLGVAGQQTSVDTNIFDLFEDNDSVLGIEANFQARNGPWTLLADPTWLRVEDDFHLSGDLGVRLNGDVTADTVILDLMVMREVWRMDIGAPVVEKGMPKHGLALDLLGGTRMWILSLNGDFDLSTPGPIFDDLSRDVDRTETWADVVFGARGTWDITDRLHLLLRGDIGGFHIVSDLTSEQWGSLVYDFGLFGRDAFAAVGYRGLYTDYDPDGGFLMKTWLHGPTIGVGMKF